MIDTQSILNSLSQEEFKNILLALDSKNDAIFFELYKNCPLKIKPLFEEEDYFTDIFCRRIEKIKDENLFNDWFFNQGLSDFYDIQKLRKLTKTRSGNQKLAHYLEKQDKPNSLEGLISTAFYYRKESPEKYKEIIKENKAKFESLNDRKFTQKSKIIETLFYFLKKESTQDVLTITKELNLDILKINSNSEKRFCHFEIAELSLEQIKEMYTGVLGRNNIQIYENFSTLFSYGTNWELKPYHLVFDILENHSDLEKHEKGNYIFEKVVNTSEEMLRNVNVREKWNYIFENLNTNKKDIQEIHLEQLVEYECTRLRVNHKYTEQFVEKIKSLQEDVFACIYPVFSKLTKNLDENINKKSNKPKI